MDAFRFELSQQEIGPISLNESILEWKSGLKIIAKCGGRVFDGMSYTFYVENAYKNYMSWDGYSSIQEFVLSDEIKKSESSIGSFPTYSCKEATFCFISGNYINTHLEHLLKELDNYIIVEKISDFTFKIKIKDDKNLIIFNFMPHNIGLYISIITRKSQ